MSDLAPGLLIAAPNLLDPNFAKSIVLMAEHNEDGAVGFILNRETPITLNVFLKGVDKDLAAVAEDHGIGGEHVLVGGPVQRHIAWVLYQRQNGDDDLDEGAIKVGDGLVVGASMDILRSLVSRERSGPFYVLLGYSGWGTQQLESELGHGSWLPLALGDDLAFGTPIEDRWEVAVRRLGLEPGGFIMGGSGASA
jgi:putative transcriptional regulator